MRIVSNRREFLTQMSLMVLLPRGLKALGTQTATSKVEANLGSDQLQILAAAMDEIIPGGDGMPSATDAGGLEYLQYLGWQYPGIEEEIARFLITIRQEAGARFGTEFLSLQHEQRVQLLAGMEKDPAPSFAGFVGYVYEAYYTRPMVQGAFSCPRSPAVAGDVDTLLAPVRNMKHLYREVL
jgi:gluconate 2-dehydrogenase subunit 3-like protein